MKNSAVKVPIDVTIMIVGFFDPHAFKINRQHNMVCGMIILIDNKI